MVWRRIRQGRRRIALATIVSVGLTQASVGPVEAAGMSRGAAMAATGEMMSDRSIDEMGGPETAGPGMLGPASESQLQGYGCLVGGGTAAVLTTISGPNEMVLVIAGGTLLPTSVLGLAVALAGTVVASLCAMGALATPAVVRLWDIYYGGMRPVSP